jgi:xanthine dehydrogenase accessory factor
MSSGDDEPLVHAALARELPYVAMVASRRRAESVVDALRANGLSEEAIARLKAPAGLDIGAGTGAEIALSILAEVVQRRRAGKPAPAIAPPADRADAASTDATAPALMAIDPICGMQVDMESARWTAERDGQTFYFCAPGCRKAFVAEPVSRA